MNCNNIYCCNHISNQPNWKKKLYGNCINAMIIDDLNNCDLRKKWEAGAKSVVQPIVILRPLVKEYLEKKKIYENTPELLVSHELYKKILNEFHTAQSDLTEKVCELVGAV